VAEMLLQSHEGYIDPLPALPAAWRNGSYEGLVARGNFVVSVAWKQGKICQMNILSRAGGDCVIQYSDIANYVIKDAKGKRVKTIKEKKNRIRFTTQQKNTYFLTYP
jgi:alpha-L-fucosidase 2